MWLFSFNGNEMKLLNHKASYQQIERQNSNSKITKPTFTCQIEKDNFTAWSITPSVYKFLHVKFVIFFLWTPHVKMNKEYWEYPKANISLT